MIKIIWLAAFAFIVIWVHNRVEEDKPFLEAENACFKKAVTGDDMDVCFRLMDKHKAEREKR